MIYGSFISFQGMDIFVFFSVESASFFSTTATNGNSEILSYLVQIYDFQRTVDCKDWLKGEDA